MASTYMQQRQRTSRRSTAAGLVGIGLMAIAIVLTLTHLIGNVVPTVLALLGLAILIGGIATGSLLVLNNFRYRRDQSYYDED